MNQERRQPKDTEDQINLIELLTPIWANRWLVLLIITVSFIATYIYAKVESTTAYRTNVLFQVTERSPTLFSSNSSTLLGVSQPPSTAVEVALIKSRYMLEPVVEQLGLDLSVSPRYFPFFGAYYAHQHGRGLAKPLFGLNQYAWGREELTFKKFILPAGMGYGSFTLVSGADGKSYSLYDANHRQVLTGAVGQDVRKWTDQGEWLVNVFRLIANPGAVFDVSKIGVEPLATNLANQLKIEDASAEGFTQAGVLKMSLVGPDPDYIVRVLNAVSKMAIQKDTEQKAAEATKTLAFLNQQLPLIRASLDNTEKALSERQSKLGARELNLKSRFLLSQIIDTEKLVEQNRIDRIEALQSFTPVSPVILTLDAKQKELTRLLASLQVQLNQLPTSDQVTLNLRRNLQIKTQLYTGLLNNIQSLELVKGGMVSGIRLLAPAEAPQLVPVSIKKTLLYSLLLSFLLSSAIIFLRELLYRKVTNPDHIEEQFGLTNLAIVPYSKSLGDIDKTRAITKDPMRVVLAKMRPKDLSIEALRSFRTSLQLVMMESKNNIFCVTGLTTGVGKSFISINLAYLLANAGKKILLIDGDIRKGYLVKYVSMEKKKGFAEVLSGKENFDQVVLREIAPNLDLLPTGAYPAEPSELLTRANLQAFLEEVSSLYDLVLIDTSPILAVTDATIIAQYAGATFLVLAAGQHTGHEISLGLKRLNVHGIQTNGVIFNFSKKEMWLNRYSYAYYQNYEYEYK